jgi:hypothetical protein
MVAYGFLVLDRRRPTAAARVLDKIGRRVVSGDW